LPVTTKVKSQSLKNFEQLKLPVEIIPQGRLNIPDAIEDGLSFIENAIIKARHASKISGNLLWLMTLVFVFRS
jgi:inosine/xanthosine triphosphate pyrophosphatase family protein